MKLWNKGTDPNKLIERFTVGNDYLLDMRLVPFDCQASLAHAKMLKKINLLSDEECNALCEGLKEILALHEKGDFYIKPEDEDCHTAIESWLVSKIGEVGKKIHTARSRNDQVLTALRLYEKKELSEIKELLQDFDETLGKAIRKFGHIRIPGYTHTRKAMPSTVGMWLSCFKEATKDNIYLLNLINYMVDQSPLGTAAGFGVPVFNIDRDMTASELEFDRVMENPLYVQMSRGKFEATIAHLCSQIVFDLNKIATDLILFGMDQFKFVTLPEEFCTGSSIMPQKKNPDPLELVRGKYHIILGEEVKIKSLIANLISGYNRDLQLTKEPLFTAFDTTKDCISVLNLVLGGLTFNKENCEKAVTPELFATREAYKLVKEGVAFRDAYRQIGQKYL